MPWATAHLDSYVLIILIVQILLMMDVSKAKQPGLVMAIVMMVHGD